MQERGPGGGRSKRPRRRPTHFLRTVCLERLGLKSLHLGRVPKPGMYGCGRCAYGVRAPLPGDLEIGRRHKALLIGVAKGYRRCRETSTPSRRVLPVPSGARRPDRPWDGRPHRRLCPGWQSVTMRWSASRGVDRPSRARTDPRDPTLCERPLEAVGTPTPGDYPAPSARDSAAEGEPGQVRTATRQ
jgi:hypothetical protein